MVNNTLDDGEVDGFFSWVNKNHKDKFPIEDNDKRARVIGELVALYKKRNG